MIENVAIHHGFGADFKPRSFTFHVLAGGFIKFLVLAPSGFVVGQIGIDFVANAESNKFKIRNLSKNIINQPVVARDDLRIIKRFVFLIPGHPQVIGIDGIHR